MSDFRIEHWPVSLALLIPFLALAAAFGLWGWAADRRARRRALRTLLGPRRARGDESRGRAS